MFYPVKHTQDGHYVIYAFRSEPQAVRLLEASWRISDGLLRHLVTRKED